MEQILFALWGLGGAFIYAGPRCLFCRRSCNAQGRADCYLEAMVALVVGAIAAGAYTVWAGHYLGKMIFYDGDAFAATIGLLANPLAPPLVRVLSKRVLTKASGEKSGETQLDPPHA